MLNFFVYSSLLGNEGNNTAGNPLTNSRGFSETKTGFWYLNSLNHPWDSFFVSLAPFSKGTVFKGAREVE